MNSNELLVLNGGLPLGPIRERCQMQSLRKKVKSIVWGEDIYPTIEGYSKTTKLIIGALLGSLTVILQSAGIFAGLGYVLSMMSTGPLVVACLLSLKIGVMTYLVTSLLLVFIQPTELLVFLFTTGLLGLSLGIGLTYFKKRMYVVLFAALCLTIGICTLLYGFKFAVLGSSVSVQINGKLILGTFLFSLLYSWIWQKISRSLIKILNKIPNSRRGEK